MDNDCDRDLLQVATPRSSEDQASETMYVSKIFHVATCVKL